MLLIDSLETFEYKYVKELLKHPPIKSELRKLVEDEVCGFRTLLEDVCINCVGVCARIEEERYKEMQRVKRVWSERIRGAGPTEDDGVRGEYEKELKECEVKYGVMKGKAVGIFEKLVEEYPFHTKELKRIFREGVEKKEDDCLQVLMKRGVTGEMDEVTRGRNEYVCLYR